MKLRTESYIKSRESLEFIEIDREYYFGELCDGDGDINELLESGSIAVYEQETCKIVDFEIVIKDKNVLDTVVKVLDIS